MKADPKTSAGRAFVRSLNILLKFARLYGYEHVRTIEQLQIAWEELRSAIPVGTGAGLLLGATNSQLLLDGVPLEGSPAEKQFAQLLSAAGLASVQFFASVTEEEIGRFVRAFPTGKAKPAQLALQLKAALAGAKGIHINEIYFVATDARLKDASIAAQIAAASLGGDQDEFREWLNDPQKLLELIAAAQGSKSGGVSGPGSGGPEAVVKAPGAGSSRGDYGSGYVGGIAGSGTNSRMIAGLGAGKGNGRGGSAEPSEEEIYGILSALTSFGHVGTGQGGVAAAGAFQEQVSQLPGRAQDMLKQALASLAAQAPNAKPDESVIVQLAEHLAIRFALERFERGEVKVNSVRQMLDRMNQEIENLRRILGAHEDKMSEAGLLVQSHRDILDREFWAGVPESGKRAVLLSEEAWCIPPRNVQSYVGELIKQGNIAEAVSILQNYAACAESEESDARKKTAVGLSEMAELYSKADPKLLSVALRHLGLRLSVEPESELQGLVGAAFVRLSQEAATSRCFPAMEQALDLIAGVESHRPGIVLSMRAKMGIEERVPEFVEEALKARQVAAGLTNVLKLLPQAAMEQLAARFNRCSLRDDSEHIANLASDLGEKGVEYLRSAVRGGPIAEAVELAGLLSRLEPESVMEYLPGRMKDFPRSLQDRIIRQISASGATGRCQILLKMLDHVDPLVAPLVIDEIGVTSDREALGKLLTLADGDLPPGGGQYLRVKAIEALGRIQAHESAITLKRIAEAKKVFGWLHPQELRIAALQALENLDPDWVRDYLPKSGIDEEDLKLAPLETPVASKFVRQRRHTRVRMRKTIRAVCTNLKEGCSMEIKTASMTGGVATLSRHLSPGTQVQLRLQIGMRNLQATALMRDSRAQDMAFEIVDMNLDERGKYRRMLTGQLSNSSNTQGPTESALILAPAGNAGTK